MPGSFNNLLIPVKLAHPQILDNQPGSCCVWGKISQWLKLAGQDFQCHSFGERRLLRYLGWMEEFITVTIPPEAKCWFG